MKQNATRETQLKDQIQNKLGLKHDKLSQQELDYILKDQIQNKLGLKLTYKLNADLIIKVLKIKSKTN